ncbi:MAG TPA: penicillin acylase family protein [bacterium]|nr:penicillin acylase family protein [bacterium]
MTALLVLAALVLVVLGVRWLLFRAPLPMLDGTLDLPGLSAPVDVLRDEWGVPHIYAETIEDACFAQGVVHAQDRLWQMELNRRVGSGRLAEIFGELALPADRFLRRMGLRRAAQEEAAHLAPEERAVLTAYARGVNAAVARMRGRMPLEFKLLGIRFEPWTIDDSLCWAKVMALNLCANLDGEMYRAKLIAKVGPERAALFELHDPASLSVIVPPGGRATDPVRELSALYESVKPFLSTGFSAASNNWVVSGARTASGKPMLANDPHLTLGIPSIWYEVHLVVEAGDRDVYGVSLPASPGVVIGHNRDVAWGMTNSFSDVQDLFLEKFDEKDHDLYEFKGALERARIVEERIRVKGQPDRIERVQITRHGPVLVDQRGKSPALALRWSAHDPGHLVGALLRMNAAHDAHEFREALRLWHTPSQNFVYADTKGNIGYLMAGVLPKRAKGSGFAPAPGWTGEYEWIGNVPFEELPQSWNPECGFIATANNAVVDQAGFPHHVSWDYMNGFRAQRIEDRIVECGQNGRKITAKDFSSIQMDVWCRPGHRFAELVAKRSLAPTGAVEKAALAELVRWNGSADVDSIGTTIYESMLLAVVKRGFGAELGPELLEDILAKGPHPLAPASMLLGRYVRVVLRALGSDDRRYFETTRKGAADPWRDVLAEALGDACADLTSRFGTSDVSRWRWGAVHTLSLAHPLGAKKPLHLLFPGLEVEIGGDTDTPLQTAYVPGKPFGVSAWAPSWRQIVDLADVRRTVSVFATGQSGHPSSPHWLDQFGLWHRGEYHPQWLDRADVERHLEGWLRLRPGS